MAKNQHGAAPVWFLVGLFALTIAPAVFAQQEPTSDDEFASIALDDETPNSRASTPRPSPPINEPSTAVTTEPAEFEQLPYLTGDWNGWRRQLIEKGITLEALAILEGTRNFSGGSRQGNTGQYLIDVYLTLDTEALFQLKGGTFFVDFQSHGGESASQAG